MTLQETVLKKCGERWRNAYMHSLAVGSLLRHPRPAGGYWVSGLNAGRGVSIRVPSPGRTHEQIATEVVNYLEAVMDNPCAIGIYTTGAEIYPELQSAIVTVIFIETLSDDWDWRDRSWLTKSHRTNA